VGAPSHSSPIPEKRLHLSCHPMGVRRHVEGLFCRKDLRVCFLAILFLLSHDGVPLLNRHVIYSQQNPTCSPWASKVVAAGSSHYSCQTRWQSVRSGTSRICDVLQLRSFDQYIQGRARPFGYPLGGLKSVDGA
jgi:hypothetical protein